MSPKKTKISTKRIRPATADHVRAAQGAGRVGNLDPDDAADHLVWMVERRCYVHVANGNRSPDSLVESLTAMWVSVLYPEAPGPPRRRPGQRHRGPPAGRHRGL